MYINMDKAMAQLDQLKATGKVWTGRKCPQPNVKIVSIKRSRKPRFSGAKAKQRSVYSKFMPLVDGLAMERYKMLKEICPQPEGIYPQRSIYETLKVIKKPAFEVFMDFVRQQQATSHPFTLPSESLARIAANLAVHENQGPFMKAWEYIKTHGLSMSQPGKTQHTFWNIIRREG